MTSLPSGSIPAASQPRIIGSRSPDRPTPRSDQMSWWFSAAAFTVTVTQPSRSFGSGRSPSSRPISGSSASVCTAVAANMPATLVERMAPAQPRELPEVLVGSDELAPMLNREGGQVGVRHELPRCPGLKAQVPEDVPETATRADDLRMGLRTDRLGIIQCSIRGGCIWIVTPVRDDTDYPAQREIRYRVRLGTGNERVHPGTVLWMLVYLTSMGVDHHVRVDEHHQQQPPENVRCLPGG